MIDKIFRMYLMLLNNDKLTAKRLADELDISSRTVYRYVDDLSLAGVPIVTDKGSNGGIYLCQDCKIYSTTLSKDEQNVLLSAIDMLDNGSNLDIVENIKNKIKALNHNTSSVFSLENKKVVVDNSYINRKDKLRAKISAIDKALSKHYILEIQYHDRHENISNREIEPITFVIQEGTWYIYAWCHTRCDARLFKLSRISHIRKTDRTFEPRKIDQNWTLAYDDGAPFVELYLEVNDKARYDVEEWLGIDSIVTKKGKNIAIASIKDNDALYSRLLSFGNNIKVTSPASVKSKLEAKIMELAKVY